LKIKDNEENSRWRGERKLMHVRGSKIAQLLTVKEEMKVDRLENDCTCNSGKK